MIWPICHHTIFNINYLGPTFFGNLRANRTSQDTDQSTRGGFQHLLFQLIGLYASAKNKQKKDKKKKTEERNCAVKTKIICPNRVLENSIQEERLPLLRLVSCDVAGQCYIHHYGTATSHSALSKFKSHRLLSPSLNCLHSSSSLHPSLHALSSLLHPVHSVPAAQLVHWSTTQDFTPRWDPIRIMNANHKLFLWLCISLKEYSCRHLERWSEQSVLAFPCSYNGLQRHPKKSQCERKTISVHRIISNCLWTIFPAPRIHLVQLSSYL